MFLSLNKLLWSKKHITLWHVAQTLHSELSPDPSSKHWPCHRQATGPLEPRGLHLQSGGDTTHLTNLSWDLNEVMDRSAVKHVSAGVGKLQSWGKPPILPGKLYWHPATHTRSVLSGATSAVRQQSWILAAETKYPTKPKIITFWPCKNIYQPLI